MVYALGFAIIKYNYGYTVVPGMGSRCSAGNVDISLLTPNYFIVMPTPYELWSDSAQDAIFPLYLLFSIAWGLEM